MSGDPAQMLEIVRDALLEYTRKHAEVALPDYQVQSAVIIGQSGRLITEDNAKYGNDIPGGLRLTMHDGSEYDLILKHAAGL